MKVPSTPGPSASEGRRSAESLLATLQAARKQIDALAYAHLPLERAISFERARRGASLEEDLLSLVGEILDREVGIWRRGFAARAAAREADWPAAPPVGSPPGEPGFVARPPRSVGSVPLADAPTREPIVRPLPVSVNADVAESASQAAALRPAALPEPEGPPAGAEKAPSVHLVPVPDLVEAPAEDFLRDEDDTLTDRDKVRLDGDDPVVGEEEDDEIAWVVEGRETHPHEEHGPHISMQDLAPPVDEDLFLRDSFRSEGAQLRSQPEATESAEEDIESLVLQELERAQAEAEAAPPAESVSTDYFEPAPRDGEPPAGDLPGDGLAGDDLGSDDLVLVSDDLASEELVSDDLVSDDLASSDLVSGDLVGGDLVGAELASDDLVSGDLVSADFASDGLVSGDLVSDELAEEIAARGELVSDASEEELVREPGEEGEVIEAGDELALEDGASLDDLDDLVMDGPTALSQEEAETAADRRGDHVVPRVETLFDDPEILGESEAVSVSDDLVLEEPEPLLEDEPEEEELRPEVDPASRALAGELMFARNPFLSEAEDGEEVIGADLVPLGAATAVLGSPALASEEPERSPAGAPPEARPQLQLSKEPIPEPNAQDALAQDSLEEATVVIHSLTVIPLAATPPDPETEPTATFSSPFPGEDARPADESDTSPGRSAAVQILSDGKARTLGHTLELEAAEDADAFLGAAAGDGGQLSVTLEEEFDEEPPIPMLTETAEPMRIHGDAPARPEVPRQEIARRLAEAQQIEERGDMQRASLLYGDVIDLDPRSLDARMGRGRCLMELGDYAAAMSDFQHAEDLDPNSARPAFEMGNLFYARKDYRRAIDFYTHAVEQDADLALARVRRGMSHYYRREYQQALQDLERARAMDAAIPGLESSINKVIRAMEGRD